MTPTGYLVVFELQPISGIGSSFVGRWDGGCRDEGKTEREDLDIDIRGVPESERRRFENQQGVYSGHHSKRLQSATGRVYEVHIRTPKEGMIFKATVTFGVLRKLGFQTTMAGFQATLGKVVGRDD